MSRKKWSWANLFLFWYTKCPNHSLSKKKKKKRDDLARRNTNLSDLHPNVQNFTGSWCKRVKKGWRCKIVPVWVLWTPIFKPVGLWYHSNPFYLWTHYLSRNANTALSKVVGTAAGLFGGVQSWIWDKGTDQTRHRDIINFSAFEDIAFDPKKYVYIECFS